tara:strand:+ start:713 stop:1081 length:369 start_codon:yes stop_codon:yes gene_type:complete
MQFVTLKATDLSHQEKYFSVLLGGSCGDSLSFLMPWDNDPKSSSFLLYSLDYDFKPKQMPFRVYISYETYKWQLSVNNIYIENNGIKLGALWRLKKDIFGNPIETIFKPKFGMSLTLSFFTA